MRNTNTMLDKLLEQEAALKHKIKDARKQEEKKKAQIQVKKAKIIGVAVLAEIETNQLFKQSLQPIIDRHIKNTKDRKMLGLPPLNTAEDTPPTNGNGPEKKSDTVVSITETTQHAKEQQQPEQTKAFWKA
jgi:hypothetical protein